MWKSHPKALPYLFLSEMWERFGYYLMIGIFTLYLKDVEAGFAMTEKEASDLYGTFIAFVFFNVFVGMNCKSLECFGFGQSLNE